MTVFSRRDILYLSLCWPLGFAAGTRAKAAPANLHEEILALAAQQQERRRARFAAVKSPQDLSALQQELRQKFLDLLGGLPEASGPPPVRKVGRIDGGDYVVEKLAFESFPGYFVPALLYRPKKVAGRVPGVVSPCGHSAVGKADASYQILHVNLAKRGYVVLTYDPVGQGERSQFWDAEKKRSRFNLTWGEHAVLGNPLYLLGTSLARYRIWDGVRAIDYLAARPEVNARKIGCVGNSGGGTLTAYLSAVDPRVAAAVICCYVTTLPRRMANRIQTDPDADPEQDIFDFVGAGIDHAGLLALRAPRPILLGTARFDFFPIEGARETFAEAKRLYELVDAGDRVERVEAPERHGLTLPLRRAAYGWFDRWLHGRGDNPRTEEIAVVTRPTRELLVCEGGQVNVGFRSRPLLPLALREFQKRQKGPPIPLKQLLRLDPERADFSLTEVAEAGVGKPLVVCLNGTAAPDWREEKEFLHALSQAGFGVAVLDPRGVGRLRPALEVKGRDYGDPLCGVEENIAYNAFLVGKSLIGMRVTDVLAAVARISQKSAAGIVLCARRDAALVACLAAAVEPRVRRVAVEELMLSFLPLFAAKGQPINAAEVVPALLRDFGDVPDVLEAIAPRKVFLAAPRGESGRPIRTVPFTKKRFTSEPGLLVDWLSR